MMVLRSPFIKNSNAVQVLRNQRGILTVDWLLAFVLVMGFSVILFSLSITLTVVEITQYATFAGARSFYASHFTTSDQRSLGNAKLNQLLSNPVFATFYSNGWFEVQNPEVAEYVGIADGRDEGDSAVNLFQGARLVLKANMLDFEIPGYGSTASSEFGTDNGFVTTIASYLSKEPSFRECVGFNIERWKAIKQLQVPSGMAAYDTAPTSDSAALAIHDNGC